MIDDKENETETPMVPLEPSEETPSIPMTPLEPSELKFAKFWVEIEERGFVVGYSSSELTYQSVKYKFSELPEDFETHFSFYRLNEELSLVYDRTRVDELIAKQEEEANKPTQEELMEALINENRALKDRVTFTEDALMDLILTRGVEI